MNDLGSENLNNETEQETQKGVWPDFSSMTISLVSFVAFFYVLYVWFNFWTAAMLMISLTVHEAGHLWAMHRSGLGLRGLYFLPGLGAAAVPSRNFESAKEESFAAIMGPVWGTTLGIIALTLCWLTAWPEFMVMAWFCIIINLFNLLPIPPLDGGRVIRGSVHAISPSFSLWFFGGLLLALPVCLSLIQVNWLFIVLVTAFASLDFYQYWHKVREEQEILYLFNELKGEKDTLTRMHADAAFSARHEEGEPINDEMLAATKRLREDAEYQRICEIAQAAKRKRLKPFSIRREPVFADEVYSDCGELMLLVVYGARDYKEKTMNRRTAFGYGLAYFTLVATLLVLSAVAAFMMNPSELAQLLN